LAPIDNVIVIRKEFISAIDTDIEENRAFDIAGIIREIPETLLINSVDIEEKIERIINNYSERDFPTGIENIDYIRLVSGREVLREKTETGTNNYYIALVKDFGFSR
jgi:hypothetical protein